MPIVGDVLADRYRIESVLGVGGMASVYRATDLRLDREVAVKVLVANLAADAQFAARFNREAGAMAGFSHPNVVAVYDVEPGDPAIGREPFYVMEYCRGGSLADRLKIDGRIPPAELMPIVAAVSVGLSELHRNGLVHRDVKPANILFANDRPKLADFGVAWNQEPRDGDPMTLPGTTLGTAPYLAPELAAGVSPSAASDVYALGVTIFQSLTGQYPQPPTAPEATVDSQPVMVLPVSVAAPDLGQRFDAALARALDADPAARPSPVELATLLTARLEDWGVARPNPGAVAAPYARQDAPSGVDMEAPTRVDLEGPPVAQPPDAGLQQPASEQPAAQEPARHAPAAEEPVRQQPALQRRASARSPSGRAGYGRRAIFVAMLAVLAVLLLPRLLGGDHGLPGASATASAKASAAASATAPSSNGEPILAALSRVDAAIEAARGGKDGVKGREGNELAQLAASVRTNVDRGDLAAAATATQVLSDRARALAKDLDAPRRTALLAAIDELSRALSSR